MDDPVFKKNPSKNPENPQTVIQITDETSGKINKNQPMSSPILTKDPENSQTVIQITDEVSEKNKKKSPVPAIILASQNSSSRNLMKTRITSVKELEKALVVTQRTHRDRSAESTPKPVRKPVAPLNRSAGSASKPVRKRSASLSNEDAPSLRRQKKSFLPQSLVQLTGKALDDSYEKEYTEKEVWAFIQSCNPVLHEFAQKHKLGLDDVGVFAECLQQLDINPKLITEHMHVNNQQGDKNIIRQLMDRFFGDPYEQHVNNLNEQYAKMQRNNPEAYKALLLELMKKTIDQADGQINNRSMIADTHTALQSQAIAENKQQERINATIGSIVAVLGLASGWATSIWQFSTPCTNHTS